MGTGYFLTLRAYTFAVISPQWKSCLSPFCISSREKEGLTMMRKLLVLTVLTLFVTVVATGRTSAAPEGDGGGLLGILDLDTQTQIEDLFATWDPTILSSDPGTMQFGPYPSTTGDQGTCGFAGATDARNRFFLFRTLDARADTYSARRNSKSE